LFIIHIVKDARYGTVTNNNVSKTLFPPSGKTVGTYGLSSAR